MPVYDKQISQGHGCLEIMRSNRFFVDGLNEVNGFIVNVVRFVGAQQLSASSRIAARHWGTITYPNGDVLDMGINGMTTPQIKKIIGGVTKVYNRGESVELKKLNQLRSQLESLGMCTDEVDAKIEAKKLEIEAESRRVDNSKEIKKLEKEISKLSKLVDSLTALGLSTDEVMDKIVALQAQIRSLTN